MKDWILLFLSQIGVPKKTLRKIMGLSAYEIHKLTEREKMTKSLWVYVMRRDKYVCYICGHFKCPSGMEADHVKPISKYGLTIASNLRASCKHCNRSKGAKITQVEVVGVLGFLKAVKYQIVGR